MIHILNYFSCLFSKQWSMPLCAFFTTFTIVMTILVLSTDLNGGRHYIDFNSSYVWDFEESPQDAVELSNLISSEYIFPPVTYPYSENITIKPSEHILKLFRRKRFGVFLECGSDGHGDTEWLERVMHWRGLLTQPHPETFASLLKMERGRSHTAQVCISPNKYPKHASFRDPTHNESLITIPCFPLYSMMRAYNATHLDLLSLKAVTAPFQVLRSLPIGGIQIKVISITNPGVSNDGSIYENVSASNPDLINLLDQWGYKVVTKCADQRTTCYFICWRAYCPSLMSNNLVT